MKFQIPESEETEKGDNLSPASPRFVMIRHKFRQINGAAGGLFPSKKLFSPRRSQSRAASRLAELLRAILKAAPSGSSLLYSGEMLKS
ncbi:MAG: hypothetical protein Q4C60_06635 [Eubacteriales bacterium]|nr:hypothetical protein [Eubacteriales bacterium]